VVPFLANTSHTPVDAACWSLNQVRHPSASVTSSSGRSTGARYRCRAGDPGHWGWVHDFSRTRAACAPVLPVTAQYSPLMTKYEPRIVPANFDFCRANLNESSSVGISIPSDSLKPTARFGLGPSIVYRTLIDSPLR